jgi:NAD(P)-dependent dehydrogenase (short-subunit alcohol dehydrogenase family)
MSTSSSADRDRGPVALTFAAGLYDGAHVLVTGGTSGIGAAIARGFLQFGAKVTATGAFPAELEAAGGDPVLARAELHQLDVTDGPAVAAHVGRLERLDILVNCAGIIRRGEEHEPEAFAQVVDVNLNGTLRACAAARPLLAASRGSIVNTASMLSFHGGGHAPAYSASKGGVAQLTKSLAIAYAAEGIRVNAIAPGWIATPLTKGAREDEARSQAIVERTAMKRWGEPEELVGAVLFLCSPAAGFVTGVILPVDGGYLVM